MSKPLLLSGGSGKVQELVGTATGQTVVWSEGPNEWVLGTPSSSGGGGVTWYLNKNTTAGSPTTNLPTGASGVVVKNLSATADGTSTTAASTASLPVLPADPEIIAGFVTDATVPGLTGIPAGLWDFNIWAQANGNTTRQSYIQFKVYKYDGSTAPTLLASSVPVYLYDPADVTQYTASVLIPAGTSLLATDRIYVEVVGGSTTSNRQITLHFGNGEPSHVHTTIQVPVNLATGVSGTLPVGNGGTGATTLTGYVKGAGTATMTASASIPVADVTGAAPLASPTFTGAPLSTTAAVDTNTTQIATTAYVVGQGYAKLASPAFTGTPSLPTGTTGFTQSAGNNTTALATTAFVTTAVAASSGAPYDVAGEYIGKPPVSTVLMRFVSNRSWTLKNSLVRASCTAFPTGSNAVATISIAGSNLTSGTITWTTTSTVTVGSFTDTTITAGQAVVLTLTTADSGDVFENPFFTLGGVVA